jgi:hypothetical protein
MHVAQIEEQSLYISVVLMIYGTMGTTYHGLRGKEQRGQPRVGPLSSKTRVRLPITQVV